LLEPRETLKTASRSRLTAQNAENRFAPQADRANAARFSLNLLKMNAATQAGLFSTITAKDEKACVQRKLGNLKELLQFKAGR